jgi:hypothetical protein
MLRGSIIPGVVLLAASRPRTGDHGGPFHPCFGVRKVPLERPAAARASGFARFAALAEPPR